MTYERQRQSIDLTRKLTALKEIYSTDYSPPKQLIYSSEKTRDLPEDYLILLTCFCNAHKMRLKEKEKLSEIEKTQFEETAKDFQTPIAMTQNQSRGIYTVDFAKQSSEWELPKTQ